MYLHWSAGIDDDEANEHETSEDGASSTHVCSPRFDRLPASGQGGHQAFHGPVDALCQPVLILESVAQTLLRPPAPHQPVRAAVHDVDYKGALLESGDSAAAIAAGTKSAARIDRVNVQPIPDHGVEVNAKIGGILFTGSFVSLQEHLALDRALHVILEEAVGVEPRIASRQCVGRAPVECREA
jgi:hypothetical protein